MPSTRDGDNPYPPITGIPYSRSWPILPSWKASEQVITGIGMTVTNASGCVKPNHIYNENTKKYYPCCPFYSYSADIHRVNRGSIGSKCCPFATPCYPRKNCKIYPNYFTLDFSIEKTGRNQAGFWGFS